MSLYSAAIRRVVDSLGAQLAMIDRSHDSIERIDALATKLQRQGLNASAQITPSGSLLITAEIDEKAETIQAIEGTGHMVIAHSAGQWLITPPDNLVNALPAILQFDE